MLEGMKVPVGPGPAFPFKLRLRDQLILAATALAMILLAVRGYNYPTWDAAYFEYTGRAMIQGHSLYRDVWDNKLPSIFLINALWQFLFGQNYAVHDVAETAIDLISVGLFARLVACDDTQDWAPAAALFGIVLAVIGFPDDTEHYALLLILAGLLCARRRRYVISGILFVLAATFWIPAILTILAVVADGRDRRYVTIVAAAIAGVAGVIIGVAVLGAPLSLELVASWTAYVGKGTSLAERFQDVRSYVPKLLIVAAVALPGITVFRSLHSPRGRFAAGWFVAAFAGALLPLRPWVHYFIPTIAASIYAMLAGGVRVDVRRSLAVCITLIALLGFWDLRNHRAASTESLMIARVANTLHRGLDPNARISTDGYEPGLFLAMDAPLVDRFQLSYQWNGPFVRAATGLGRSELMEKYIRASDAFVDVDGSMHFNSSAPAFSEICRPELAPWRVYIRTALAKRFSSSSCGDEAAPDRAASKEP
jgi:hypothetical protein